MPAAHANGATSLCWILGLLIIGVFVWIFWKWPAEHRVNRFFTTLKQQQFEKAYGI